MSHESHESPIKTPKQLIGVIVAAFLIPIIGIIMLASWVSGGDKKGAGTDPMSDKAIAARIVAEAEAVEHALKQEQADTLAAVAVAAFRMISDKDERLAIRGNCNRQSRRRPAATCSETRFAGKAAMVWYDLRLPLAVCCIIQEQNQQDEKAKIIASHFGYLS